MNKCTLLPEVVTLADLKQIILNKLTNQFAGMSLTRLSRALGLHFNDLGLRFAIKELVDEGKVEKRIFGYGVRYAIQGGPGES